MKYALTILCTALILAVQAQTLTPDWAHALGGGADVYTKDVVTDASGNSYLVGYFSGTGVDFALGGTNTTTLDSEGGTDAFFAKYSNTGELAWVHTFGTTGTERFNAITLSQTGDLLLVGYLSSNATGFDLDPGANTITVTSSNDALVAKFDTNGQYLDHFVIGGENTAIQEFHDIAVNQGDTIYVGGYSEYPGADMDPDTDVSQLYSNSASTDGIMGVYAPDFDFLYGRRTQSNKGSEFYKIGIDAHGDAYALIRWAYETTNFDGSIIFENTPTYAAAFGSYVTIGKEEFISGQGYRRGFGMNVVKLSKSGTATWYRSFIGGTSTDANLVNDFIGVGDYIYLAGQINNTYFYQSSLKTIGTNGTHGYVFRLGTNGSGFVDKYFKTTTTAADYVHSIDTAGSNLIVSGHWNGTASIDLDPGAGSYTIDHSNPAAYWVEFDGDINFVQGGFLASSDGSIGMTKPNLMSLGNDQFLFTGYHDDISIYQDSYVGPDVIGTGTALSKLNFTPNQAPEIVKNLNDTLVGDYTYQLTNIETLFTDPEGEELTFTVSADFSEDFSVSMSNEGTNYSLNISFMNYVTAPVTITASDPFGGSTDMTYNVTWVQPSRIKNTYPVDGQSFVPLDTTIGFSYETSLETSNLKDLLKVNSHFRGIIEGEWTLTSDTLIFDPTTNFLPGEHITVTVSKGLQSATSGELAVPQSFSFQTTTTAAVNELSHESTTLGYSGQEVTDAIFADLNANGHLDVIASSSFNKDLVYLLSDSSGGFHAPVKVADNDALSEIQAIDVNNDGHLDIVANSSSEGTFVYYHDGKLNFHRSQVFNGGSQITGFDAADYNLDGLVDFVRSDKFNKNIQILTQQADSTFVSTTITPNTTIYDMQDVIFGDFTGDGLVDIAWTDGYTVNPGVYLHNQKLDGSFSYNDQVLRNYKATKLHAVDIDQDGDLDITYARDQAYGIGVLLNNGSGAFTNKGISDSENFDTNKITAGDIDSDGDIDLLVTGEYTKKVIAHLNDGEENFTKKVIHTTGTVPNTLNLGDVDGDLDLDILVTTINTGSVTVLENLVVKLLPPSIENSIGSINIYEDQMDTLITDQIDTLFTNPEGGSMTYSVTSATDSVSATIDANSLTLSADYDFNGTTEIYLSATNSIGTTTDTISITVNAVDDQPLVSSPFDDIIADEDALNATLDMTTAFTELDGELLTFNYELISGENLLSIEVVMDSQLTLIGVADSFGTAELVIIAEDPQANSVSDTITITINAVNDAPIFEIDRSSITVGLNFSSTEIIQVTDLSLPNESDQTITYSLSPASVSFANVNIDASTGEVSITSVSGEFGTQEFTITADDGQNNNNIATESFDLEVLNNQPPVIETTIGDQTFDEDATDRVLVADITTLFSDPEGASLTLTSSSDNSDITVDIAGNSLSYSATLNYFGIANITVIASDGGSTTEQQFLLTINPVNDAPVVNNTVTDQTATEDQPFSFALPTDQFTDVDNEDLSLSLVGVPDWLTFDGLALIFHGTPTNGDVGSSTISITAEDGELSVTDEFTLTVTNVNDAPQFASTIQNIAITEDAGDVVLMDLDTVVVDEDGDELYFYAEGEQGVGSVTINDNNELVVNVPANLFGSDNIYLYAEDAETFIETTFTLTVTPVNDAPYFTADATELNFQVNNTQSQVITLSPEASVFGEESEEITYNIMQNDASILDISVSGLEVSVTPTGVSGTETFTIQANDGQAENNLHEVTIEVTVAEVLGETIQLVKVYPNPSTDRLYISNLQNGDYVIFDQTGSTVLKGKLSSQAIDVTKLPKGIYTLRLIGGEGGSSLVSRFIKN